MAELTLYHASPSRSSVVLWMLEELGQPYDVKLIRLSEGENLKPEYLAINPMGTVPALSHRGTVITEVAAICTYLADEFPQAKLNIPVGTPQRGAAQGAGAPRNARIRRFRHDHGRGREGRGERTVADGRAVHRGGRRHRRECALGYDVQDAARAEGVHRLRRADCGASDGAARGGEGQGVAGGVTFRAADESDARLATQR